jgi:serine/threonine protein phosphatase PrpC
MKPTIHLVAAAASDTGLVRQQNEDAAYSGRCLYAVADGLGGHAAGEIASAVVIDSLRHQDADVGKDALLQTLGRAITKANASVAVAAAEDPARRGMGTTLTAMLWSGDRFALGHIGDSRAFRLREGEFRQITEDHVLDKLVSNAGRFGPVLARYLDGRSDRSPDLRLHEALTGDRYMICSDGLSPIVQPIAIRQVLASVAEPDEAVRRLTTLAMRAGGPDNITVIIIDVREALGDSEAVRPAVLGSAGTETLLG